MAETTLTARVDDTGHLPPQVRRRIATLLLRHKNHDVTLTLTRTAPARSTSANRRYWSMLRVAAASLGYDSANDLHDGLALRLLRIDDDPILKTPRRTSTASLDSAAFVIYADAAMRLLIDFGADLSDWDARPEEMARARRLAVPEVAHATILARERRAAIRQAVARLTPRERFVLRRRHHDGDPVTYRVIGLQLNVTTNTARNIHLRALFRLRFIKAGLHAFAEQPTTQVKAAWLAHLRGETRWRAGASPEVW